ncbi:MAG: hypothetical protein PVF74_00160, partial [Anaerolineales bacterium]
EQDIRLIVQATLDVRRFFVVAFHCATVHFTHQVVKQRLHIWGRLAHPHRGQAFTKPKFLISLSHVGEAQGVSD